MWLLRYMMMLVWVSFSWRRMRRVWNNSVLLLFCCDFTLISWWHNTSIKMLNEAALKIQIDAIKINYSKARESGVGGRRKKSMRFTVNITVGFFMSPVGKLMVCVACVTTNIYCTCSKLCRPQSLIHKLSVSATGAFVMWLFVKCFLQDVWEATWSVWGITSDSTN